MGNIEFPEVNDYRVEIDRLWDSLEAVFAVAMWQPSSVPSIRTQFVDGVITVESSYAVSYFDIKKPIR